MTPPTQEQHPEGAALSAADRRILEMESAALTGHTLKVLMLDPGPPLAVEAVRADVAERLERIPRARQIVSADGTRWVEAVEIDIASHVRHRPLPAGADDDALRRELGVLMAEHLDRSRPLWSIDVLGPLADGRQAVAVRVHHAMADGIGFARFLEAVLLDPFDAPRHAAGIRDASPHGLAHVRRMPGALWHELGYPTAAHSAGRAAAAPFDRVVTGARELAFAALNLPTLRGIGAARAEHATVNDVLLSVVAGGLRAWAGPRPPSLRAQIPVSLHTSQESADQLGNRDSFLDVDLLVHVEDPGVRLDGIAAQTRRAKHDEDAAVLFDLFAAADRWGAAGARLRALADSPREFALAISNVPGPAVAVSAAGRPVARMFTAVEPASHHALRVAAISCHDQLGVGFCVDPGAVADVTGLASAVERAYEDLASTVT